MAASDADSAIGSDDEAAVLVIDEPTGQGLDAGGVQGVGDGVRGDGGGDRDLGMGPRTER
jgi:hypothetical protein